MAVSGIQTQSISTSTNDEREMYYMKGSIEAVLDRCRFYYLSDESTPGLDTTTRNVILNKAKAAAARGLRVIATAYGYGSIASVEGGGVSPSTGGISRPATPSSDNLVFTGFQAMLDPPRKGVADAISLLQNGGVQVVMITGDAEETALSIARKLGLRVGGQAHGPSHGRNTSVGEIGIGQGSGRPGGCLTGKEIDQLSRTQLMERVGGVSVFARTTPRHKMAIVQAFQDRGAVVAMTGDGGKIVTLSDDRLGV
jgi:P-type Ca2+ transporter type 2C